MSQTVFGAEATVIYLNRAFNNSNPTSAAFQNQVRAAGTTDASQYAFAAQFGQGASVASFSEAALAEKFLTNLGILPSTNAAITAFTAELASYLTGISVADRGIVGLQLGQILATLEGATAPELAPFATAAVAWNEEITTSWLAVTGNTPVVPGFELGTGRDNLLGTTGDDTFTAHIIDNANTLQSGDKINGGAGNDTLNADIGTSQNFAITPELTNVEAVKIRVQADQRDSGDNNIAGVGIIDAERSVGVNHWESNNSRADLIIEDVRIAATQKTSDITIAMVETDPGDVDFGVYFDQHSLRNASTGQTSLNIRLMDTGAAGNPATADTPLLNNPYDQFKIGVNGQLVTINLDKVAVAAADTYEAFLTVFNTALAESGLVAQLQGTFTITDPITDAQVTGKQIFLSGPSGVVIESMPGAGWFNTTGASVPATSNIYTTYNSNASSTTELVTSKVILDDVGRGSTGGDLVIGGLSVGDTSSSRGVERFEIEVRDNSKLQTINSTNNALREVTIVNGATSNTVANAYTTTVADQGDLTVNGDAAQLNGLRASNNANTALPGVENNSPAGVHHGAGAAGFTDVRLIDASTFQGKLAFTADITHDSIAKYINLADVQSNPAGDVAGAGNVNFNVRGANFAYTGGNDNDTMVVNIDGAVAASHTLSGREDFTFNLNGGAGNDAITVDIGSNGINGENGEWRIDQFALKNITVDGGEGNDVINVQGAGAFNVAAGAGNDTVYVDNTGAKSTWVAAAANTDVNNLQSAASMGRGFLYKGVVTVTFAAGNESGLTAGMAAILANGFEAAANVPTDANYAVTQYHINQAIKAAVQNSTVLNKLLTVADGPGTTLIITSKIDGSVVAGDLNINVRGADLTGLGVAEQATILTAYKQFAANSTATIADANSAETAAVTAANAVTGVGTTVLAASGTASSAHNDSIINAGAGDDVVVLGTGTFSNDTVVFTGYNQGTTTIVNFNNGGSGADSLNFSSYLTGRVSTSGSVESQTVIPTTFNADSVVEANSISTLTFTNSTTDKFANLTPEKLLAAINSTNTGAASFGGINATSLSANTSYVGAGVGTTLVGGVGKAVVMVENMDNRGEYKAFELTFNGTVAGNANADFTGAQLISTIDLGNTLVNAGGAVLGGNVSALEGAVIPTPGAPTYALAAGAAAADEGTNATFTLTTTNVAAGTAVPYTLTGVQAADVVGGFPNGTAIVGADGKATITVALAADSLTEGAETLTVTAVGKTASTIVNDTSLTVDPTAPTYDLVAGAAAADEGTNATFTLITTNVAAGTVVPYTLTGVDAADVVGDFPNGTATVGADGTATITVALAADSTTEGAETLTVTAEGKTASTIVNDTSVTPAGITVAGNTTVPATAAADVFMLDVATALVDAAGTNTNATITGFDKLADKLVFDMATADATITTLAQLMGQQGVTIEEDPFLEGGSVFINFGQDANGAEPVTLTLSGVAIADLGAVLVSVI